MHVTTYLSVFTLCGLYLHLYLYIFIFPVSFVCVYHNAFASMFVFTFVCKYLFILVFMYLCRCNIKATRYKPTSLELMELTDTGKNFDDDYVHLRCRKIMR